MSQHVTTQEANIGDFITVMEAKEFLRIPSSQTAEDALIQSIIAQSVTRAERYTDVQLIPNKTIGIAAMISDRKDDAKIELPFPASTQSNFAVTDAEGNQVDFTKLSRSVHISRTDLPKSRLVTVSFDSVASPDKPDLMKPAVLQLIAEQYSIRTDTAEGTKRKANTVMQQLSAFKESTVFL